MKKTIFIIQILVCVICISNCSLKDKKNINEKIYGQKTPGNIPMIFEPKFDFIKNGSPEEFDFSPDLNEFIYTLKNNDANKEIFITQKINGTWMNPEIAYFVPNNSTGYNPKFSPDGRYISYGLKGDIWKSTKNGDKWTVAEKMSEPINTNGYECSISFAQSGSVYLAGNGRIKGNRCDIYCLKNTELDTNSISHLDNLSTKSGECMIAIAPNEKYIIFTRSFYENGRNVTDLYISFRKKDESWTVAQKLGPYFNTSETNHSPNFSNDGRYFSSNKEIGIKYWREI